MLSIEALSLPLIALYVIDAVVVCDPGATLIVGWRPGGARARRGLEVSLGRPRLIAMGRLLPPLSPLMIVDGDRLDANAAAAVHARMRSELRLLRVLTIALFVSVFVLLPGAVLSPSGVFRPDRVLLLIGLVWFAVAVAALVAVRRLYPDPGSRPSVTMTLLSPISAIRVMDVIARRLLAPWHPVAVARVLCGREDYLAVARTACFSASKVKWALISFWRSVGDWDALQAAPRAENGCTWYCPKCHAQFLERSVGCPDCCVSLRALQPAASIAARSMPVEGRI